MLPMYDVIIAGASFGGLAVAAQLQGYRVLLIDRKPVGSGQTSACGTMLPVLNYWGLMDTVLQIQDRVILHTARDDFSFPSPYLWCTFDYARFCEKLFKRSGADFLLAAVQGSEGGVVHTNKGTFQARFIVDATGWHATLGSKKIAGFGKRPPMNFGIETVRPKVPDALASPDALHFWYEKDLLKSGVGWVFPRGETASLGLVSYFGATQLAKPLKHFTKQFDRAPKGIHGTYLPHTLRPVVSPNIQDPVFMVGDAAGMCIGLTGEGIRPALFFGEACGRILQRVLANKISDAAACTEYQSFVGRRQLFFRIFSSLQAVLSRVPVRWIDGVSRFVSHDRVCPWVMRHYWGLTREWGEQGDVLATN